MPERFFAFYGESLVGEQLALGIDSDYVFVALEPRFQGRPMTYDNAVRRVKAIGRRAGISLTPHTLRHTHGTDLARHDWTAPLIAKRLGHSSATSADIYIHLADDDIASKYTSRQWGTCDRAPSRPHRSAGEPYRRYDEPSRPAGPVAGRRLAHRAPFAAGHQRHKYLRGSGVRPACWPS